MDENAEKISFTEKSMRTIIIAYGVFCLLFLALLMFVDSDFHRFLVTIVVSMGAFYVLAGVSIVRAKYYFALLLIIVAYIINVNVWFYGTSLAFVLIFDILPTIFFVYVVWLALSKE